MDAIQHLTRTRAVTVRIFVFAVLAFFLVHGLFGFVRRHMGTTGKEHAVNMPSPFDAVQGRQ